MDIQSVCIITTILLLILVTASLLKSDGKTLATAAAQLKIFNSSNHKKIQKFSGHPVSLIYIYIYIYFPIVMCILYQCLVICPINKQACFLKLSL